MLDCCRPLNDIAQVGLTLSEFACLARCNGLQAQVVSPLLDWSPQEREKGLERFRNDLRRVSRGDGTMALSYSRKTLGQTGDGHFSPIGALCEEKDMVLILDVARFKYPSYWVPVSLAYEAMFPLDKATGQPRGYVLLRTAGSEPGSLDAPQTLTTSSWAALNTTLSRTLLSQAKSGSSLADLLLALLSTLADPPTPPLGPRRTEAATRDLPALLDALSTTRLAALVPFASAPKPNAVLTNLVFLLAALSPRSALAAMIPPAAANELASLREDAISAVDGLGDEVASATRQLGALGECCRSEEGNEAQCGCAGPDPKPIAPVE
ncbi:hypothetical protein B0A53_03593 [Rhodotorula sp. CCFEE 5036]|nr:hypothetical protein B0A53_03593 [Rhodotorula sp. CCFEE 5036]